jgi:hypothetical protein
MLILSGMKPDRTGVGRLMSCLVEEAAARPAGDVRIHCRPFWKRPLDLLRRGRIFRSLGAWYGDRQWQRLLDEPSIRNAQPLVLIQPQTLGIAWCEKLLERRRLPTWLYLMDSSFFCVRSYNHIDGEHAACTRCIGGRWQWAAQLGCGPWPIADAATGRFLERLREWLMAGQVRCLVQNERQAELIQAHCSGRAVTQVVGLWTSDLDCGPAERQEISPHDRPTVVFHGASIAAKGAAWAIEVARHCPQIDFHFPFRPRQLPGVAAEPPANAKFAPLTWETGLAEQVAAATLVLVPSLWSATMEGALLKSIMTARAVAVVEEATAYSSELPAGLVLRLPGDPCQAAQQLAAAVARRWQPHAQLRANWVAKFQRENRHVLDRLIAACSRSAGDWAQSPQAA